MKLPTGTRAARRFKRAKRQAGRRSRRRNAISGLDKPNRATYKPPILTPPGVWRAQVAQLVEHATENRSVGGSIPPLGTNKINNLFEW
jgi:hypothetical protein